MSIMKKRIVLVNQSSGFLVVDDLNAYCTKYDCVSILCAGIKEGVRSINPKVQIDKINIEILKLYIIQTLLWHVSPHYC